MVSATHRKMDQPPEARPVRRQDTAMERRGAQVSPIARRDRAPQGAIHKERLAALHPLGVSEGEGKKAGCPGPSRTGAMSHDPRSSSSAKAEDPALLPSDGRAGSSAFADDDEARGDGASLFDN